jgi:fimbrial chaperone protein
MRKILAALLLSVGIARADAASLMVAPTTLVLKANGEIANLYVTNRGDKEAIAQIEGFDWSQVNGHDTLTPSTDLVLSPPMAHIAPGETQVIRLEAGGGAAMGERSFRVVVSEIPNGNQTADGVNLLLQFSIPVFVASGAKNGALSFDVSRNDSGLLVTARNDGLKHVKLNQLSLAREEKAGGESAKGLVYILPGARYVWRFPKSEIAPGESVRVEAKGEAGAQVADVTVGR